MPNHNPPTPLILFLEKLASIKTRGEETRCIGVLEKMRGLPESEDGKALLDKIDETFTSYLREVGWDDVGRWINSWLLSPQGGMENLARTLDRASESYGSPFFIVGKWNRRLRQQVDQVIKDEVDDHTILCAFSSTIDATYPLNAEASLADLIKHASIYKNVAPDDLLRMAYHEHLKDPTRDRDRVSTVNEALAEILFAYKNPRENLKPTLEPGSEAEDWIRRFVIDKLVDDSMSGGGASLNIADSLAGLRFSSHVFWPYHPRRLANLKLRCVGDLRNKLFRCWFDKNWKWKQSDFIEAGNQRDGTGHEHPVRLSLVLSFSPQSPSIVIPGRSQKFAPADKGRVIFQFQGYRSAEFFEDRNGRTEGWEIPPVFCRWRYRRERNFEIATTVTSTTYHRVILSAFQRAGSELLDDLGAQCQGMAVHHEISAAFDDCKVVEKYCDALRKVYKNAKGRSAGINTDELAGLTSWQGTEVFSAALPDRKDSFLQCLYRATKVREAFQFDWLYVHGNDIDITVVNPGFDEHYLERLGDAMLLAKVVVFAALHVRSGINTVKPEYELSCSPKGFLALYQFASDFARQYGRSDDERRELERQILIEGYVRGNGIMPSVVTAPVYWPDPDEECGMAGAGDISSGVTAAMAP